MENGPIGAVTRGIALTTLALLVAACGGGEGGRNDEYVVPPERTASDTTPRISWFDHLSEPASQKVVLTVLVAPTTSGTKQVDFFVDGVMLGTSTAGAAQPGVSAKAYSMVWDSAPYADGPHSVTARVTDNANLTAETSPRVITLKNNISIPFIMSPNQLLPTPSSPAAGAGQFSVNVATGEITGDILLTNMTASGVDLHSGWPTTSGPRIIALTFDTATQRWIIPPNATLSTSGNASQVSALLTGGIYIDAHSATYPDGEIRAQVLPSTISLAFGPLSGNQELPPVSSQGSGLVSVMEDRANQIFRINARTVGLNNVISIGVYGVQGPAVQSNWLFFLRPDSSGNMTATGNLTTAGYDAGAWFMNVTTGSYVTGEIGGLLPIIDRSTVGH